MTASEVGCYTYCAKAWHLQYVGKVEVTPEISARRADGVALHRVHGKHTRLVGRLGRHHLLLIAMLLALAALAFLAAASL